MKLVQIPSIGSTTKTAKKQAYIGVLDASGSMSSYWKDVATMYNQYMPKRNLTTITFDGSARICGSNHLSTHLNDHGGGCTNIIKAFHLMDEQIGKLDLDTHVVILFVSDGQDNQNGGDFEKRLQGLRGHQGRSVTFLCLGVQSGFPTFISMQLREHYHNTQSTIPALFLIEYASEKAFFNKFESMKPFFTSIEKRNVSPSVLVTPWEPLQSSAYEGTWVTSTSTEMLHVDGIPLPFTKDQFSSKAVAELFRGYVQELEMLSVSKDAGLKDKAAVTLVHMYKVLEILKATTGMDVLGESVAAEYKDGILGGWHGFRHRALSNELLHRKFWIRSYVENVKLSAEGVGAADLNEWDAAKRIGIGTLVGKHQQKALGAKGLTAETFNELKRDFGNVLSQTKLSSHLSGQDFSAVTLQNQKDVFLEPDFGLGLNYISSQFDLVEAFPIVGLPLKVKRPEGSVGNPWLVQVKLIARTMKAIDSLSMIKMEGTDRSYRMLVPIGEGQTEEVNAVLPLFGSEDRDMVALLSHPLFHLLMTFNVTLGLDAIVWDAYLALLAAALIHLLPLKPTSTWRTELMDRICTTTNLIYGSHAEYLSYQRKLVSDPCGTMTVGHETNWGLSMTVGDENENDPSKGGNLSLPLFHLFVLNHGGLLSGTDCDAILANLFIEYYRKHIAAEGLGSVVEFVASKDLATDVIESMTTKNLDFFHSVYTMREVKEAVHRRTGELLQARMTMKSDDENAAVRVRTEKLEDLEATKVTLLHLKALYGMCHKNGNGDNNEPSCGQHLTWVYLAYLRHQNDAKALTSIQCEWMSVDEIAVELGKLVAPTLQTNISGEACPEVCAAYSKWFGSVHREVLPMSYTELQTKCQQTGIDISTLVYDSTSGFVKNACMSADCPFYLQAKPNVRHHVFAWGPKLPNGFHKTVRKYVDRHPQFILAMFMQQTETRNSGGGGNRGAKKTIMLSEFDVTEEMVLASGWGPSADRH